MNKRAFKIFPYVLFGVSLIILGFSVASVVQIKVLKDWHIILPNQPIHAGDTILVESVFTKIRSATGVSHRYILCESSPGFYLKYTLATAVADYPPGQGGTAAQMILPTIVKPLPTSCYITYYNTYNIWWFWNVTQFATSKNFTLLSPVSLQTATQTSPSTVSSSVSGSSSYPNSTPSPSVGVSNIPQSASPAQNPTPQPTSLLCKILPFNLGC